MNLQIFPVTIADLERRLLKQNQAIRELKEEIEGCDFGFDAEIAFDETLKNDLQRKVRRRELAASNQDYQTLLLKFQKATAVARLIEIDLDLTKNQFAVAKLEARERIASVEEAVAC